MEGSEKIHQVCISDKNEHWQTKIDQIRDSIVNNPPDDITHTELWDIRKKRGTSGVLKLLIRLGHERFCQ